MAAPVNATQFQWPADVLDFAARHNARRYLAPLLEATQRIFPDAESHNVFLEIDPEISDDCHISFEVRAPGLDLLQASDGRNSWIRDLYGSCPAPLAPLFRLSLVLGD